MGWTLGLALFFVIWWVVLFAVLPIGVRTQGEDGAVVPGTPSSAPAHPRLLRVAGLTTVIAGLVFGLVWLVVTQPKARALLCMVTGPALCMAPGGT
jgi:predicted secreted protein